MTSMNREEVREIVDECLAKCPLMCEDEVSALVKSTVRETLTGLGVDHAQPLEFQKDMAWVRDVRRASAAARAKAAAALLGILLTAAAGALWLGVRSLISGGAR